MRQFRQTRAKAIQNSRSPRLEVRALGRAFHRRQLLPQRQVLQDQFPMAAERQRQRAADHDEQLQHASIVAGVGAKINGDEFWRGSTDPAVNPNAAVMAEFKARVEKYAALHKDLAKGPAAQKEDTERGTDQRTENGPGREDSSRSRHCQARRHLLS